MTYICVSVLTFIGSDNGLSPGRRQAIIRTNAGILLKRPLGTNFSEILIEILLFPFKKMRLTVSIAKRRPFCLGLNVLSQNLNWLWKSEGSNQLSKSWCYLQAVSALAWLEQPTSDTITKWLGCIGNELRKNPISNILNFELIIYYSNGPISQMQDRLHEAAWGRECGWVGGGVGWGSSFHQE